MAPSGGGFRNYFFFSAHFLPYSLLHPYFISSHHSGALWWWIRELIFLRTSILTPFAPLFHIVTPRWRPLVVDSGTKFYFFAHFHLYSLCTPISYRHATVAPSGGEFRNYFFFALPSLLSLHPYFISSRYGGALWWWIPELKFFLSHFHPYFLCTPISYRHATVAPSVGGFRN